MLYKYLLNCFDLMYLKKHVIQIFIKWYMFSLLNICLISLKSRTLYTNIVEVIYYGFKISSPFYFFIT